MREKLIYATGAVAAILLVRNLYEMLLGLPDEVLQGAIYRIIFFHVPAAFTFGTAAFASLVASVIYLVRRNLSYDAFAAAATEVAVVFATANLVSGMIWARIIWGVWWAWDARLTSMLISWLMYAGYVVLRRSIDDPTQRATTSAALSILTFPGVIITYKAIDWWRTQHPGPVLSFRTGNSEGMDPAMQSVLYLNWLALMLFAIVLLMIRIRQEDVQRELDGLRREMHAI